MAPATHERLALALMVAICAAFASWGIACYGVSGLAALLPGLVVAGLVHKLVVENLPIRCPECAGKIIVRTFDGDMPIERHEPSASFYSCRSCDYEARVRFF
jgi:hypothetical protein